MITNMHHGGCKSRTQKDKEDRVSINIYKRDKNMNDGYRYLTEDLYCSKKYGNVHDVHRCSTLGLEPVRDMEK